MKTKYETFYYFISHSDTFNSVIKRDLWTNDYYSDTLQPNEKMTNFFMSFCTIFSYIILGWYHDNLLIKLSKQTSYWSRTGFFSHLKKYINNIFIANYCDIIPKQRTKISYKGHEQVCLLSHPYLFRKKLAWLWIRRNSFFH